MLLVELNDKMYNTELRNLVIIIGNSTIINNLNNICTHLSYAINNYIDTNNVNEIKIFYDYPKVKNMVCQKNKMYYELSKILKPTIKKNTFDVEIINQACDYIIMNGNKNDVICIDGITSPFIHQDIINSLNILSTYTYSNRIIFIRSECESKMIGLINDINHFHVLRNEYLLLDISFLPISETIILKDFNISNEIDFIDITHEYYMYNKFYVVTKNINKELLIVKDNFTIKHIDIEPTIHHMLDTILLFENYLLSDKIINSEKCLEMYTFYNETVKKLHQIARDTGNNNDYRCASLVQLHLQNCNKIILKKYITHKNVNEDSFVSAIAEYHINSDSKFKNNHLNKNFLNNITKNINLMDDLKKNTNDFLEQYENKITNLENEPNINESLNFYTSNITLSNWLDELQSGSTLGLLIKVTTTDLGKVGICRETIDISNITTTFISIKDYIESAIIRFSSEQYFGNLNQITIFSGDAIGDSNAAVPLYISKEHWELSKIFMKPLLGIIISHNPFAYIQSHDNFMFSLLASMTRQTYLNDNNKTEKWLNIYLTVLRTCKQIGKEKGYDKGINKLLINFINDPLYRLNKKSSDNDILIGQILSLGINNNISINLIIERIFEESLRSKITKNYKEDFYEFLITKPDEEIIEEMNALIMYAEQAIMFAIEIMITFYNMNSALSQIENLIKNIDDGYGVLPGHQLQQFKHAINIDQTYSIANLYQMRNMDGWKIITAKYLIQMIKFPTNKKRKEALDNNTIKQIEIDDSDDYEMIDIVKGN